MTSQEALDEWIADLAEAIASYMSWKKHREELKAMIAQSNDSRLPPLIDTVDMLMWASVDRMSELMESKP